MILGVKINSDWIDRERLGGKKCIALFVGIEILNLQLNLVLIWIAIIERRGRPVINCPERFDALGFEPFIGSDKITQAIVGKRDYGLHLRCRLAYRSEWEYS